MDRLDQPGELGQLTARAELLAGDVRLREAVAAMGRDPRLARVALTAPREFAGEFGVEVPEDLTLTFVRPEPGGPRDPFGGKFVPDFEFIVIRQFDCRTFNVPDRDEDGKIVGWHLQTVCFGFEITPKFLPRAPWS
jgi:hypothetical protein